MEGRGSEKIGKKVRGKREKRGLWLNERLERNGVRPEMELESCWISENS